MNTEYLFIGGSPRSGTSLLSALIGNLPGVAVAQDLCLFFYLKLAAIKVMLRTQKVPLSEAELPLHAGNMAPSFDTRLTEFFPEFLNSSLEDSLNQFSSQISGKVLREFISLMDTFLFCDLNRPDPRKDRGQGASYLKCIDIPELLDKQSMKQVLQSVLESSATSLCGSGHSAPNIICDKTPENLACIDVIDQVMSQNGFKFLHLLRDPVSVFGARRQRVDTVVDDFIEFFRVYSEPSALTENCNSFATIRYEDILIDPASAIRSVVKGLGLSGLTDEVSFDKLSKNINPGKYISYVGQKIDPQRDLDNRALVNKEEQEFIYQELASYCEKYSYGPYAKVE